MATPFTIETMAMAHPQCAYIHREIKELIPENDLLALMGAGFTDCSYGNETTKINSLILWNGFISK